MGNGGGVLASLVGTISGRGSSKLNGRAPIRPRARWGQARVGQGRSPEGAGDDHRQRAHVISEDQGTIARKSVSISRDHGTIARGPLSISGEQRTIFRGPRSIFRDLGTILGGPMSISGDQRTF